MGMVFNNLCNSCTNIGCEFQSGIVRTKCAFYMPPHIGPDNYRNYVVMQPTVEAIQRADIQKALKEGLKDISENVLAIVREEYISKADYENRLKTDMIAMLTKLQLQMEEYKPKWVENNEQAVASCRTWEDLNRIIQNKIDTLEENKNERLNR